MQKLLLSIAALAVIGLITPSVLPASADDTVVIHKQHRHFFPMERHHGKTVIIKKHEHDEDRD